MDEDGDPAKPHTLADHDGPQDLAEMVHQALHVLLELRGQVARAVEPPKQPHATRGRKR